ncbi:dihydrofolate reductase family protein [Chitinophaga sp. GCM10012297]|uniref:Dihydrofolate reductase family protein n=1 Tax=Chitinophaga chungangae TaxID=2821488 RepID=A0ABS3YH72_9BACT|nr:dihydrofolate reductase family protein [Chitinophaga chungangae]MBO9154026.1 dihydrofolate reductase family protein [Chitinophaga chungangae]
MGKLSAFNFLTLNGFYQGKEQGDINWHTHQAGGEEAEYAAEGAGSDSTLVFGRVTYDMMSAWWPTPAAIETMPGIAEGMNRSEKIVFSRTLKKADWNNTRIIKDNIGEAVRKLKKDRDMTILGSGSIVTQLSDLGLIDQYQLMIDPVALGEGKTIFSGMQKQLNLKLVGHRIFKSGAVMLTYEPA